ncbi:NAD-dependent epimerase/dehydratase family protein [Aeromicrobium sp. S22]|uniref:NAD-dependent epimerase/dehydratase family protein n=1 Tax=Aeromicrobium sp. S22 TaxID=2662029 RepID=UPI00129DC5A7|nr:NAD-dependent epimerase/dehydratase family protein [Aeromicrobium sp. S22]MRK00048.1 NAD-dependent epimerase/dehydratase family protein [Aeromicrobium sp. S22]
MGEMLVLGGTSWVGGEIARAAAARGHQVTCLARGESGDAPPEATFVRADRATEGAYDQVRSRGWDMVVDVSRQPGQVRSAVATLGDLAGHWTLVSTGSVYADQGVALSESSPLLPALEQDVADAERYGEGKVACEAYVRELPTHLVVRAGLVGGPGDRSDRLGYYVSRLALAGDQPVLVPDVPDQPMQVIDVRDLADWIVRSAEDRATGIVHGAGEPTTVGELIGLSAEVAGHRGERVAAGPDWLRAHDVEEWMGPRSLPLWLPPDHHGMGMMDDARALATGLRRRPLAETLRGTLEDERARGLDRDRRAGLDRDDELALLAELRP